MPIEHADCAATYKVIIVGDSGVGKSAILKHLVGKTFDERWRPTVGVDFVSKIIEADGALIELRIWDTAGLESFRSMTRRQFRGVQGVFLVYDVTDRMSFDSLSHWISSIPNGATTASTSRHSYEPIPFLVLGNKADLTDKRKVTTLKGMKMANTSMAFDFYETSAKTGRNVFAAFHKMAFTITDLNHPRLMKSYHRHQIRPLGTKENVMNASRRLSMTSLPPSSSSFVTMRQNATNSTKSSSPTKTPTSASASNRRHTVSALPFSILRAKTKTIKEKAKRKSWSVSLSISKSKQGNKKRESDLSSRSSSRNERSRKSFGGWRQKSVASFFSRNKEDKIEKFEKFEKLEKLEKQNKNRSSGNFSSNIIISEPSMTLERAKAQISSVKKKKKSKGRMRKTGHMFFSCFGWKKKRKKEK